MGERLLCFGIGLLMSKSPRPAPTRSRHDCWNAVDEQDGGVLRKGTRGLSEALMGTEVNRHGAPTDTKVSLIPSSNCFASTLLA